MVADVYKPDYERRGRQPPECGRRSSVAGGCRCRASRPRSLARPALDSLDELCVPEHEPGSVVAQIVGAQQVKSDHRRDPQPHVPKLDRRIRSPAPLMKIKPSLGKLARASPRPQFCSGITNAHRHLRRLEVRHRPEMPTRPRSTVVDCRMNWHCRQPEVACRAVPMVMRMVDATQPNQVR